MAHYAFINDNNVVVEVIVGIDETESVNGITGTVGWEQFYASQRPGLKCLRTSYNRNIRKNYAGIGYTYDPVRDAFIPPRPDGEGWVLNEESCLWDWEEPNETISS
jgi:hypothetical protein